MNSGLVNADRYNDYVYDMLAEMKADSFIVDLYMGSANPDAGFRNAIGGEIGALSKYNMDLSKISYNFTALDKFAKGIHNSNTWPYFAFTYAPDPFQPSYNGQDDVVSCPGFSESGKYQCQPQPLGFSSCWKCPPRDPTGNSYTAYREISKQYATHWRELGIPILEEIWNEPDLSEHFDLPTIVTMYAGTSQDYVDMYNAAADGMLEGDPDLMLGGPSVAYNIGSDRTKSFQENRPNGADLVLSAWLKNSTFNYFSFHDVEPCFNKAVCNVTDVFITRSAWARQALVQPDVVYNSSYTGIFNTTEIHCTEYHPAVRAEQQVLPFTASPAMGVMLLNDFKTYLSETDVTRILWAQFMEVEERGNGSALLDFAGNARPAWYAFKLWGDIPIERKWAKSEDESVNVVSGFNEQECHGGVLVWNNGSSSKSLSFNIDNVPFEHFNVDIYQIDDNHIPKGNKTIEPVQSLTGQQSNNGKYRYPAGSDAKITLPISGIMYLNFTNTHCSSHEQTNLKIPKGLVLKNHHLFQFRPARTNSYAMFDRRKWAVYLGMADETKGWLVAGATVRVSTDQDLVILMNLLDGEVQSSGIWGLKVEFWDPSRNAFDSGSSLMFYDESYNLQPNDYNKPSSWDGKLMMIFALKDGTSYSKVHAYIRVDNN